LEIGPLGLGGNGFKRGSESELLEILKYASSHSVKFIETSNNQENRHLLPEAAQTESRIARLMDEVGMPFFVSAKSNSTRGEELVRDFLASRRRFGSRLKWFLLHGVNDFNDLSDRTLGGAVDALANLRSKYGIGIGFSSHSIPVAKKLMTAKDFDLVELSINIINRRADIEEWVAKLVRDDVFVVAMSPLAGGLIPALEVLYEGLLEENLAYLQWLGAVAVPTVSSVSHLRRLINVGLKQGISFSDDKEGSIQRLLSIGSLGDGICSSCQQCMPCLERGYYSGAVRLALAFEFMCLGLREKSEEIWSSYKCSDLPCETCRIVEQCCIRGLNIQARFKALKKSVTQENGL